jgi:hypothetical protein
VRFRLEGNAMALESSVKKFAVMRDSTTAEEQEYRTLVHVLER